MKPETVSALRELYNNNKDTVDYMLKFGSKIEQAKAEVILKAVQMGKLETVTL